MDKSDKKPHKNTELTGFGIDKPIPDSVNMHTIDRLKNPPKRNLLKKYNVRRKTFRLIAKQKYDGGNKDES